MRQKRVLKTCVALVVIRKLCFLHHNPTESGVGETVRHGPCNHRITLEMVGDEVRQWRWGGPTSIGEVQKKQ